MEWRRHLDSCASRIVASAWMRLGFGFACVSTIFEINLCARAKIASSPSASVSAFAPSSGGYAASAAAALSSSIPAISLPKERTREIARGGEESRTREHRSLQQQSGQGGNWGRNGEETKTECGFGLLGVVGLAILQNLNSKPDQVARTPHRR